MAQPAKRTSPRSKSTAKTSAVPTRPQPHGGALRVGGTPGNRGGTGRPPSAIRDQLRGSFAQRVAIIEDIADGRPSVKTRIVLRDVLPHVVCPNCGEPGLEAKDKATASIIEIDAQTSASPKDRIAALDLAAKYGLGVLKEVSVENVRERVAATLDVIRAHASPTQATEIINALRPVWA